MIDIHTLIREHYGKLFPEGPVGDLIRTVNRVMGSSAVAAERAELDRLEKIGGHEYYNAREAYLDSYCEDY